MSAFLGPIHYWLFNKIMLVESREKGIIALFKEKHGDEAESIASANISKNGDYFPATPLEDMIGDEPIHSYLAEAIERVETREAALIAALIEKYGDGAKAEIIEAARKDGEKIGLAEAEELHAGGPATAEDILSAVKNAFLDGMPCDHVTHTPTPTDREAVETHSECLHKDYWKNAGADAVFMCEYLGSWIDGLVEGLGGASHSRGKTVVKGDSLCEDFYRVTA